MDSVIIEPLRADAFDLVAHWLSQPTLNRWLTAEWRGRVVEPQLIAIVLRNARNRMFLVRSGGHPCGVVALADVDSLDRTAMVWYALGDDAFAGRGVISTAVRQLTALAFDHLGLRSLYAWTMADNEGSQRVLAKAGFKQVGRIRQATVSAGRQVDRVYYDLVPSDYSERA